MPGIELVKNKKTKEPYDPQLRLNAMIANLAFEKGLITYPGGGGADGIKGDHLLLAPPFIITEEQIDQLVAILDQTFTEVAKEIYPEAFLLKYRPENFQAGVDDGDTSVGSHLKDNLGNFLASASHIQGGVEVRFQLFSSF